MLFNSESDRLADLIAREGQALTERELADVLAEGRRQRAPTHDVDSKAIARRYSGDQAPIVRDALAERYPRNAPHMPVDPVNWLLFFARQDSGVYVEPAQRFLEGAEGEPIDEADPRAVEFARALDEINADGLMLEQERRAATGLGASVAVLGWRQTDPEKPGRFVAHLYWPHDVVTVAHPSAPDDPDALIYVCLRQSRDGTVTASSVWWVWSRDVEETEAGLRFGPWRHQRLSEDGKVSTPAQDYPGTRLPVVFLRTTYTSGGFWPEISRDVVANVDNLNVARSNRQHVIDMQAHATTVYQGTLRETSEITGGPGAVVQIGATEVLQFLVPGADHEAIEASATRDLQELGVSRGNSPDAYAVEPGEAQSGVSRIIANAPHDQRIAEMRPIFRAYEERDLLPVVVELVNLHGDATIGEDVTPRVKLSRQKPIEADAEKLDRVERMLAAGLVDAADARVLLGLSVDRAEALAYLDEIRASATPRVSLPGQLAGSPFTAPRETTE